MSTVNLNISQIEDFRDKLLDIIQLFENVFDDYNDLQAESDVIAENNVLGIDKVISHRTVVYNNALQQYSEIVAQSNRSGSYTAYSDLLSELSNNLRIAEQSLQRAQETKTKINNSQTNFRAEITRDVEKNDALFSELEVIINKAATSLTEFINIVNDSNKITQENPGIKSNTTPHPHNSTLASINTGVNSFADIGARINSVLGLRNISSGNNALVDNDKYYYMNNLQRPLIEGLSATEQEWHQQSNGTMVFNTPFETGNLLDSNQGKLGNFWGTCGVVSCVNVLRLSGMDITEQELVEFAATHTDKKGNTLCVAGGSDPCLNGATSAYDRNAILHSFGIESKCEPSTVENIFLNVSAGHGVIASVHADLLYYDKISNDDLHAVTITSVTYKDNKPYSVIVCDSNGMPAKEYDIATFKAALTKSPLNVTKKVIR